MGFIAILGTEKKNNVDYYYYIDYVIAPKKDGSKGVAVKGMNIISSMDMLKLLSVTQNSNNGVVLANRLMNAKATYKGSQCVGIEDCYGKFSRFQMNKKQAQGTVDLYGAKVPVIGGTGVILAEHRWTNGTIRGYTFIYRTGNPQKPWNIVTVTEKNMLKMCYVSKNMCDMTPIQNMIYRSQTTQQGTVGIGVLARNTEMYKLPSIEEKMLKAVRRPKALVPMEKEEQAGETTKVQEKPQQVQVQKPKKEMSEVDKEKYAIIKEAQELGPMYVKLITHDKELNPKQMRVILDGKKDGYPTEYFADHKFHENSMDFILGQMMSGMPDELIGVLLSDAFTVRQLFEIVQGYCDEIDYTSYAKADIDPTDMQLKRLELRHKFTRSDALSEEQMIEIAEKIAAFNSL